MIKHYIFSIHRNVSNEYYFYSSFELSILKNEYNGKNYEGKSGFVGPKFLDITFSINFLRSDF